MLLNFFPFDSFRNKYLNGVLIDLINFPKITWWITALLFILNLQFPFKAYCKYMLLFHIDCVIEKYLQDYVKTQSGKRWAEDPTVTGCRRCSPCCGNRQDMIYTFFLTLNCRGMIKIWWWKLFTAFPVTINKTIWP